MMECKLNLCGLFNDEKELKAVAARRRMCYDVEPYYISDRKKGLLQIGFELSLYGTFPESVKDATPDSEEYRQVEADVRRVAEVLSSSCNPLHMCESTTIEEGTITYSHERDMRPDITVHIPIFDQKNFGHPVDDNVVHTRQVAEELLESAGVRKTKWPE